MKKKLYLFLAVVAIVLSATLLVLMFTDVCTFPFDSWLVWIGLGVGTALMGAYGKIDNQQKSIFRVVVGAIVADSEYSKEEMAIISKLSAYFGFSKKTVKKELEEMSKSGKYQFVVPESDDDKKAMINAVAAVIKVDGKVTDSEKTFINQLANKLGFSEGYVKSLL